MPSKYVVRNFTKDSIYHVYNLGTEKKNIFLEDKDYHFFQTYLLIYLYPLKEVLKKHPDLPLRLQGKNLSKEVKLLGYCLMPNHFHLLLKQKTKNGISKLMKRITNAYTLYFNQKYQRAGGLMQGRFKAVAITDNDLLTHLIRYIHLKPITSNLTQNLNNYLWSSYPDYLGKDTELNSSKSEVFSYLKTVTDFENFHKDKENYIKEIDKITHLTIDH